MLRGSLQRPKDRHPGTPAARRRGAWVSGFSLIEVLVAGVILTLLLGAFARMGVQAERNSTTLSAAALAADSAALISAEINRGNPATLPPAGASTRTLNTGLISSLSAGEGLRSQIAAVGLVASVTALGGNPPLYRVSVDTGGTFFVVNAIGPGGSE